MPARRDYSREIEEYKSGKSLSQIAKERHLCRHVLATRLKSLGIPIRSPSTYWTQSLNHRAFDVITDEVAYWIGLLMADGCIYQYNNDTPRIKLEFAHRDKAILKRFKSFLSAEHTIHSKTISLPNTTAQYDRLDFASQRIADRLSYFGIVPQKTGREQVHYLEDNRHFWRGLIDGDGSLTWTAKYPALHLVGSQRLMEQFCEYVENHLDIHTVPRSYKNRNVWTVCIYGRKASKIAEHFYTNQTVCFKRKLDRAKQFITFYD